MMTRQIQIHSHTAAARIDHKIIGQGPYPLPQQCLSRAWILYLLHFCPCKRRMGPTNSPS
jgi:hypothetical protein